MGSPYTDQSVIGDDCVIRHNVTLGSVSRQRIPGGPTLGDRVELSPGVVIVGPVKIGADVRIGPNCVITTNIPAGATVVTSPPRVLQAPRRPAADLAIVQPGTAAPAAPATPPVAAHPGTPATGVANDDAPPVAAAAVSLPSAQRESRLVS